LETSRSTHLFALVLPTVLAKENAQNVQNKPTHEAKQHHEKNFQRRQTEPNEKKALFST